MNLGVLPAAHALYEWNIYIPAYGEVIQSLAFTPLGSHQHDACVAKGYDPKRLLEVHETVHQRLGRHGVQSIQFANRSYAGSAYNSVASAGAKIVRHVTLAECLVQLKETLLATDGKAWLGFYWAALDTIGHLHGPGTPYHAAEIASFWAHLRCRLPRRREPRHALPLHRRPRPRLYARERDALPQRAHPGAGRLPAREPHRQSDLSQRLGARRLPACAPRAPRRGAGAAAPPPRRHRAA